MAKLEQNVNVSEFDPKFLSVIFDRDFSKVLMEDKEVTKISTFEKGLASELSKNDTIEATITKIVKMALACEFGPSIVTKTGAKKMISTISRGIMGNSELRRSALIIADRFAGVPKKKVVTLQNKKSRVING